MKTILLLAATLHIAFAASIDGICPNSCTCRLADSGYEVSCSSYEFIKKLLQKQVTTIVRLDIKNSSLLSVDPKLKYIKNLNILDLSNNSISNLPAQFPYLPKLKSLNMSKNHLKAASFENLPKNLETIDISSNFITNFPKDWASLKQLKTVKIHDNPIDCDCSNILIYDQMILGGIDISRNLTCHYPKDFSGKPLSSINCSLIRDNLLNAMLGDQEGSGETEPFNSSEFEAPLFDEDEKFIGLTEEQTQTEETTYEGSGEGSGDDLIPILPIPACHINCSTPKPIGADDGADASPPPTLKERFGIIMDDFNDMIGNGKEDSENATNSTESAPETGKEEPMIVKDTDKNVVETFPTNDTVVGEMERASLQNSNSQTAYIVIGLVLAFFIFMTIYYINRKKNNKRRSNIRKRNKSNENGLGEEMKPLGKTAEKPILSEKPNSYPTKPTITAEATPLLNGQNGKISDDNAPSPDIENDDEKPEEVVLRKPTQEELLTPPVQRVTIKASEIPDSIPKTPLLVHRQKDSDGNVTTESVY